MPNSAFERPANRRQQSQPDSPPPEQGASHPAEVPDPNRWIILVGLVMSVIMEALDTTIINVALPQMGGNFGATPNEIAWVSTGYILAVVSLLPITAWLAARFGRKRYLVASVLLFTASSFFCGISHSLGQLIFWRVLQGMGGAALLSTAQATLLEIFPASQQGLVQSILGLGVVVAPALAPMLGGWLTDNYAWPWVFFVNIPVGIIATFIVATYLKNSAFGDGAGKVDIAGIGLLITGLASMQYVLEEGEQDDWFGSVLIVRLAILAAVSLAAFVAWELSPRNPAPAVNLRVLKDRSLTGGSLIGFAMGFGLTGGLFIFPLFVQGILHFTPTETGLVLLPAGIAIEVAIVICGLTLQKGADPRLLIAIGILIFIYANWDLSHLSSLSSGPNTIPGQVLRGLGIGFLFIPVTVTAYSTLKGQAIAQGTALWNLSLQLGGSFGIAALNTYVVNMTQFHRANLVGDLYNGSAALADRQNGLAQTLTGGSGGYALAQAKPAALGLIDQAVQTQAQTLAYNNAFLMIGVVFVFVFPALFLLKKPAGGAPPAGGAM